MAGVVDDIILSDNDSNKTRSFWIQGRSGPHWQNLENITESQAAILRLGELVSQDRYDELKLLESRFSPITGETDYLHVVTIRDRQVIEQPDPGAPVQQEITNQIVIPENQMVLWGDDSEEAKDHQSDFWHIEETKHEKTETASDEQAQKEPFLSRSADKSEFAAGPLETEADTTEPDGPKENAISLLAGLAERRSQRQAARHTPGRQGRSSNPEKHMNRGVLLSGALAGAFSVGLVIAAMNPQSASSIFEALLQTDPATKSTSTFNLASAVTSDNPQSVRQALIAGADPNQRDSDGLPVLLKAARGGLPLSVDLLLQAGADPGMPVFDGRSVLHLTASEGLSEPLRLMLRSGAEPDLSGGPHGCLTPLGLAAANGKIRAVGILTDFNATLDPLPGCDVSPLELASAYPVVRSRLEATAAARRNLASFGTVAPIVPTTTVSLPLSLDVPESKADQQPSAPVAVDIKPSEESETTEPQAPVIVNIFEAEGANLPEPVNLASLTPQSTLEVAALTYAPATYEAPRAPTRPSTVITDLEIESTNSITADIRLDSELTRLIQDEGVDALQATLDTHRESIDLVALEIPVLENGELSFLNPVDYAVLSGKLGHAQTLIKAGGQPSTELLHNVVDRQNEGPLHPALHFLLKNDADTNSLQDGVTPLMRAARNNDDRTTTLLLAYGADPKVISDSGLKAADIAASNKSVDIQEKLAIAEVGNAYDPLMFGLSWYDTIDKVRSRAEVCKPVSDGFLACKLSVPSWLEDTSAVIAQFDTHNGDRLVALQIDSKLFSNELEARKKFDDAVARIDEYVPANQPGFAVQELAKGMPYFESLKPSVNISNYYHYWPDEDRAKPVYLHLKMIGHTTRQGFFRLIIGNPFRIG